MSAYLRWSFRNTWWLRNTALSCRHSILSWAIFRDFGKSWFYFVIKFLTWVLWLKSWLLWNRVPWISFWNIVSLYHLRLIALFISHELFVEPFLFCFHVVSFVKGISHGELFLLAPSDPLHVFLDIWVA